MRDYNKEHQDNEERKYAYNIDYIIRDFLIEDFKPYFVPGNALELGCYHGEFSKKILPYFDKLTIVEGSEDLADIAKSNINNSKVTIHNNTFENVHLDKTFDNIFLIHTLEHLDDPILVLKKICSWLSANGKFFVAVPNAQALSRQLASAMGIIEYNSSVSPGEKSQGHNITYTFDVLLHHLNLSGFNIMTYSGTFLKPFSGFQFDKMLQQEIISEDFVHACYKLGKVYPELTGSIYAVCSKKE